MEELKLLLDYICPSCGHTELDCCTVVESKEEEGLVEFYCDSCDLYAKFRVKEIYIEEDGKGHRTIQLGEVL